MIASEETKVHLGLDEAAYAGLPGVRSSWLKTIWADSPAALKAERESGGRQSSAMAFGDAFHAYVLMTAEEFDERFFVAPKLKRNTKAGKEAAAEQEEEAAGRTIITDDDLKAIERMAASLRSNRFAASLLDAPRENRELSIVWRETLDGNTLCKCRDDGVFEQYAWDIKTARDPSEDGFRQAVRKYHYDLQAAHYLRGAQAAGMPVDRFAFLVVGNQPPYEANVWILDDDAMHYGARKREAALAAFLACDEADHWPANEQRNPDDLILNIPTNDDRFVRREKQVERFAE